MSVIPGWVYRSLGVTPERAKQFGLSGYGIQLDDRGEYDYGSLTVTFTPSDNIRCYLTVEGIPFDVTPRGLGYRLHCKEASEYLQYSDSIKEFLDAWDSRRWLRLGNRANLPPWELSSQDHFIIMMNDELFSDCFVADPRARLTLSEMLRGGTLHKPLMLRQPEGYPLPRAGGWIRSCSVA